MLPKCAILKEFLSVPSKEQGGCGRRRFGGTRIARAQQVDEKELDGGARWPRERILMLVQGRAGRNAVQLSCDSSAVES